jgi:phosphoribosylglycinamide formyltransferase 1
MALKLAVLISGRGSNLAALQRAIAERRCAAEIALVVSDRDSASGLRFAAEHALRCAVVDPQQHPDRARWDHALTEAVASSQPDLIVLAGFMRVVGPAFLARFPRRVINVHPALLPLFPGTRGPEQAIAAGMRISGCSVHVVDAGVDTGPIIAQAAVPVLPGDSSRALHERIQRAEHALLPGVIDAIARGTIRLEPEVGYRDAANAADAHTMLLSPQLSDGRA